MLWPITALLAIAAVLAVCLWRVGKGFTKGYPRD